MKLSVTLLGASLVEGSSEGCSLEGHELENLILGANPWGKFKPNYSSSRHPSGNSSYGLGSIGKLKKKKKTYEEGDSWLRCNGKGSVGKIAFKLNCSADGTFTVYDVFNNNAIVSIEELQDPDICNVGCDLNAIGMTDASFEERYRPVPKWDYEAYPTLIADKFVGTAACSGFEDNMSDTVAKCKCDMKVPTCDLTIKLKKNHPSFTSSAWLNMAELCEAEPPTIPPTLPPTDGPTTEPSGDSWGEWSEYTACSADCGGGTKIRSRTCPGDSCVGDASESRNCNNSDCDHEGCEVYFGDLKYRSDKDTGSEGTLQGQPIFREKDNYGVVRHKIYDGRQIKFASCENSDTMTPVYKNWTCKCKTNKQTNFRTCKFQNGDRFEGKINYYYMKDLECNNDRPWRWADGRRSAAQPAEEVSGGENWELCEICYDPGHSVTWGFMEGTEWNRYSNRNEHVAMGTYGTVVERESDRKLVCKYADGIEREFYYQLSIKKDEMNWAPANRFWGYIRYMREYKTNGDFDAEQMVYQVEDGPDMTRYSDIDDWNIRYSNGLIQYNGDRQGPGKWDGLGDYEFPAHRAVCRVLHNDKYYYGSIAGATIVNTLAMYQIGSLIRNAEAFKITCVASHVDEDGFITGTDDNTEYLVVGSNADTRWGDWSEWSGCAATCGETAIRTKTRQCLDANNQPVDSGKGCGVEMDAANQQTPNMFTDTYVGACNSDDFMEECPRWSWWEDWTACTNTCGGGTKNRVRNCICGYDGNDPRVCADMTHPLAADGLCGDKANGEENGVICSTNMCETSDGVGPGCFHDSLFTMGASLRCWDPVYVPGSWAWHRSISDLMYTLNPYGLINHMWQCNLDTYDKTGWSCKNSISSQKTGLWKPNNTVQCECHEGKCAWGMTLGGPEMVDCTAGYEWIQSPVASDHPFFDKLVDFDDPTKTGSDVVNAISSAHYSDNGATSVHIGSWLSGIRMIADPVAKENDAFTGLPKTQSSRGRRGSFLLINQCASGSLKWQSGPYNCNDNDCNTKYVQLDDIDSFSSMNLRGWSGLIESSSWSSFSRHGICRIWNGESGKYVMGSLIKYPDQDPDQENYTVNQPYQCCPMSWNALAEQNGGYTVGCTLRAAGHDAQPYDVLYSGDCVPESPASGPE